MKRTAMIANPRAELMLTGALLAGVAAVAAANESHAEMRTAGEAQSQAPVDTSRKGGTVKSIAGVVTDSAGRPVRGAMVKVSIGDKIIARFSDSNGRYQLAGLQPGTYDLAVDAFGFALAERPVEPGGQANFKLTASMDVARLTSAQMRYLLPETPQTHAVYLLCSNCHGLDTVLSRRGMPAAAWAGFLPHMTNVRFGTGFMSPEAAAGFAKPLADIFGPDGILGPESRPDLSKVKHIPLKDAALKATITEYTVPTRGAMPHSVSVDEKSGVVWFAAYDAISNSMTRFDPKTEKFQEFRIPLPAAHAHTGDILEDGRFIVALDKHAARTKMTIADADGRIEGIDWPQKESGARVVEMDPSNKDVLWIIAGMETWRYNRKTKQFTSYSNPRYDDFPVGSEGARTARPGERPIDRRGIGGLSGYDLTVDSKGVPWVTQLEMGVVFSIDPETGQTKLYHTPEMTSARGIDVDADDNIWFGDFFGNKLGMIDQATGEIKFYEPPDPHASPYGVVVDRKRGYVWYADTVGEKMTRFDPKTREFVEYPVPSRGSALRFSGVDPAGRAWYGGFYGGTLGVIDPGDDD